jgi:threonine dehydratase
VFRSALDAGHAVRVSVGPTLADGLAGNFEDGSVTFDLVRRTVADVVTLTEAEIASAMRFLAQEHGLVAEGSAAVGVAALLTHAVAPTGGATVVIVTGRNIAAATLAGVLNPSSC